MNNLTASLDERLTSYITAEDRLNIWASVENILDAGERGVQTTMGLGYVQSGKTTSISALCAAAADRNYKVIIAILGSTVLLKNQNTKRVEANLGLDRNSYDWGILDVTNENKLAQDITHNLERDKIVFIPVIKNATVLRKLSGAISRSDLRNTRALVIDDEADQASLNTSVGSGPRSSTNAAIQAIRDALGTHLYVQYTATPYAPLLLPADDPLIPEHIEFLLPGHGYTGGREFFISHAETVIRRIPSFDEQSTGANLSSLPESLRSAVGAFFCGATLLFEIDQTFAPISMLVHSSHKNDVQEKYRFLIQRLVTTLASFDDISKSPYAALFEQERNRLYTRGVTPIPEEVFWRRLRDALRRTEVWLVNSASAVKEIRWERAPFHILIGGNKLDRGFTVEGLTVTYMNRPASGQLDTLEQRARAFGYRGDLLPFCQFFASDKTIQILRDIVHTEDDLRSNLASSLQSGGTVREWAVEIGLLVPEGTAPSRKNVLAVLDKFNSEGEWHAIRKPLFANAPKAHNLQLIEKSGLLSAGFQDFGRQRFRSIAIELRQLIEILQDWQFDEATSGWPSQKILQFLERSARKKTAHLILVENPAEGLRRRIRKWSPDIGFINLFQGRDLDMSSADAYTGDRELGFAEFGEESVILQVHRITRRDEDDKDLFTLALHLGNQSLVRTVE